MVVVVVVVVVVVRVPFTLQRCTASHAEPPSPALECHLIQNSPFLLPNL